MKVLEINKEDIIHNINVIKRVNRIDDGLNAPQIIAVVKGNAYGMGLVEFSRVLIEQGIIFLAVATVEEALELRKNDIKCKILMLSSTAVEEDVKSLIENDIILTVGSKEAVEVAEKVAKLQNKKVPVHLKIDTGFGRYGFVYNKSLEIVNIFKKVEHLEIKGTFSHFSESYSKNYKWTSTQYDRFLNVVENLKLNKIETGILHICNSSAFFKYPYMRLNAIRIGSAFSGRILVPNTYGLKRIGSLKTKVAEIKVLPKNYFIGYSNTYKTKKDTKIAVIPVGYKDGIIMSTANDCFRFIDHLRYIYNDVKNMFKNNDIYVTINDKKYKILGKVGMYNLIIDIENHDVKIGDIVYIDTKMLYVDPKIRREYI